MSDEDEFFDKVNKGRDARRRRDLLAKQVRDAKAKAEIFRKAGIKGLKESRGLFGRGLKECSIT